jgi:phage gp29-like protein
MPKLYDHLGRPVALGRLKAEEAGPTVTGVRQVLSGHPAQGLTPGRLARLLRAAEDGDPTAYLELAEEMEEKDLHYRSVLATRKYQVAGLDITVEAATDAAEDVRAADLIRDWLSRDELRDELFDILDAVGKGYSLTEIIWDTSGGQWLPARLEWRDPRWFQFDRTDGRTPMLLSETGQPVPLSPYKYIYHAHKSKSGLPIRGGLARAIAWGYLFKMFDVKSWVEFAEVFGVPLRVGKYGPGASEADKAVLLQAVRNISKDAAAIIPASMTIDFVEAKISGSIALFEKLADWLDRQTSKAVLGQTGTTDTGSRVGTADAHERVRQDIEEADARQLAATLNRDLVRPVIDLNLGPRKLYPKIVIKRIDAEDLTALAENLGKLVPLGLKVGMSTIRDKFGLPDPAPDEELLRAPGAGHDADPAVPDPAEPLQGRQASASRRAVAATPPPAAPAQAMDAIDVAVAEELDGWQPLVDPLLASVRSLLDDCLAQGLTLREFQARLSEVLDGQDAGPLAEHLARMTFMARLGGEFENGEDAK